jgi:hypothetical protein
MIAPFGPRVVYVAADTQSALTLGPALYRIRKARLASTSQRVEVGLKAEGAHWRFAKRCLPTLCRVQDVDRCIAYAQGARDALGQVVVRRAGKD